MGSGLFSCDPHGFTCVSGNPAIHSHGVFQGNIGDVPGDVMEKDRVDAVAFLPHEILNDFNACGPELPDALSGYFGIGIRGSNDDPLDPAFDYGFSTGRLLSIMTTRLQCYVHFCPIRRFRQLLQRFSFGVQFSVPLMAAKTDDPAIFHDYRTHHGIWIGMTCRRSGQIYGMPHIFFIRFESLLHSVPFRFISMCFC